ncbi:DMT family transporter [Rhodococcus artemisiae]|uniref:DMT family transporter n=1 Tax=Rhodococcus artemisiae TaxID=714159 RepID=A0ABU7LJW3_9NOCA|nr:DMT family transporter [Rhodococcus artemisiae]MEE2061866.1 DMT family transporter [Rhodococcus artemisiae]
MTGTTAASVACALAAAVLIAVSMVAQQRSAAAVPTSGPLVGSLIRSPRWWAALAVDGGGYTLQVLALALGTVLIVQPLLVSSLLFAIPISAYYTGRRPDRRTLLLAGALCVSLAVFLIAGNPTAGAVDAAATRWALPLALVLAVTAGATALGLAPGSPGRRAMLLGTAAGILYGVAAAFTKHVTDLIEHGVFTVLGSWQTWTVIAAGLTGMYLQQRAFQAGPLTASLPTLTIAEPLAAVFLGMTVLGEHLDTDSLGLTATVAAVAVMAVTTLALARTVAPSPSGTTPAAEGTPTTRPTQP